MACNSMDPNLATAGPSNGSRQVAAIPPALNVAGSHRDSILGIRPVSEGPFAQPPVARMLEYCSTDTMGWGVFAREDIPRGTRILVETPLLAMPLNNDVSAPGNDGRGIGLTGHWSTGHFQHHRYNKDIDFFCRKVLETGLDDERIKEMETLYCLEEVACQQHTLDSFCHVLVELYLHISDPDTMAKLWGDPNIGYPEAANVLNGLTPDLIPVEAMMQLCGRYARLYDVWNENRFALAQGTATDLGVFSVASRINHSCCPNVSRSWVKIGGYLPRGQVSPDAYMAHTINTTRDIRGGEQIFLAYKDYTFVLPEFRDRDLRASHIEKCACKLCNDPVVGALQRRAWRLWHAACRWARPSQLNALVVAEQNLVMASNAFEALAMAEEVVDLLTHPSWDLRETALARAYRLASLLCEQIASNSEMAYEEALAYWQKARVYAGQMIQVYILLEGTDGTATRQADERNKELGRRRMKWLAEKRRQQQATATPSQVGPVRETTREAGQGL